MTAFDVWMSEADTQDAAMTDSDIKEWLDNCKSNPVNKPQVNEPQVNEPQVNEPQVKYTEVLGPDEAGHAEDSDSSEDSMEQPGYWAKILQSLRKNS